MDAAWAATSRGAEELLGVLAEGCRAVADALATIDDRRLPGRRPGQYALDLVADEAVCAVLHRAGLDVLSEESGRSGPSPADVDPPLLVVVDPVDGSTNASLGLPWYATSLCVLDDQGPLVAMVVNHPARATYRAVRGQGAERDGIPLVPSGRRDLAGSVIAISGFPASRPGWAQFRAMGAAALDLCAVAEGALDGYSVAGGSTLYGWDYLGAMLVCTEAGAVVAERDGRPLAVRDDSARRPVAGATATLAADLSASGL